MRALPRSATTKVVEPADHLEVLEAGQVLVDGGVLPGKTDVLADAGRIADDVEADDARRALVRSQQCCEDSNCRGFAGAVGPEEAKDRPRLDPEVYAAKSVYVAVALPEPFRLHSEAVGVHARHATHTDLSDGAHADRTAGDGALELRRPPLRH